MADVPPLHSHSPPPLEDDNDCNEESNSFQFGIQDGLKILDAEEEEGEVSPRKMVLGPNDVLPIEEKDNNSLNKLPQQNGISSSNDDQGSTHQQMNGVLDSEIEDVPLSEDRTSLEISEKISDKPSDSQLKIASTELVNDFESSDSTRIERFEQQIPIEIEESVFEEPNEIPSKDDKQTPPPQAATDLNLEIDFDDFEEFTEFSGVEEVGPVPSTSGAVDWSAFGSTNEREAEYPEEQPDDWAAFGSGEPINVPHTEQNDDWAGFSPSTDHVPEDIDVARFDWSDETLESVSESKIDDKTVVAESAKSKKDLPLLLHLFEEQMLLPWNCSFDMGSFERSETSSAPYVPSVKSPGSSSGGTKFCLWDSIGESCWESDNQGSAQRKQTNQARDNSSSRDSNQLWLAIRFLEETPGLSYHFCDRATVYSCFLKALDMDLNVAKLRSNPSIPAFAAHLKSSTLTPQPKTFSAGSDSPGSTGSGRSVTVQSASSPGGGRRVKVGLTRGTNSPQQERPGRSVDSLSVPPADFDWQNSGLNNPLTGESMEDSFGQKNCNGIQKGVNAGSTILDLEFFDVNDASLRKSALEKDLEKLGLDSPRSVNKTIDSKSADLLNSLMAKNAQLSSLPSSSRNLVPVDSLSSEAKSVLEAIPNLGFMLSSVLMFPVKEDNIKEEKK